MRENAVGYYIDFFIYPPALIALLVYAALYVHDGSLTSWLAAAAIGVAVWTFTEYLMHRLILHNVAYFKKLHDAHHDNPKALIGSYSDTC